MLSFAFAAIKKTSDDEYDPTSGPGTGGQHYDDPKDDTDPDVTYAVTNTGSAIPYTPFTLKVAASNGRTAGTHGHLLGTFSDKDILSFQILAETAWQNGAKTFTIGVTSKDASKASARFYWATAGKPESSCVVPYNAGYMVPNIVPPNVKPNKTFQYTLTFSASSGGSAVANNYGRWSDFGAEVWFEGWNGEKWERTSLISAGNISGNAASFSGTATAGDISGFSKIRLCVKYDGREMQSDEATVQLAAVSFRACPDTLHVFGADGTLTIFGEDLSLSDAENIAISAEMQGVLQNIGDWLEDDEGGSLDFTTGWTEVEGGIQWTGQIQAKSSLYDDIQQTYATLTLKATYGASTAPAQIDIIKVLTGTATPSGSIIQGVPANAEIIVRGGANGNLGIPRMPNGVTLLASPLTTTYGTPEWDSNGFWHCMAECTFPESGEIEVGIIYDFDTIGTATFNVMPISSALIEAINERYQAKGSSSRVSDNDSASTIRNAAIDAIGGFVKGEVASDGTFTSFNSSNHRIPAISEDEWEADAYEIVCGAVSRTGNATVQSNRKRGTGHYQYPEGEYDPQTDTWSIVGSESGAKNGAVADWHTSADGWSSASGGYAYQYGATDTFYGGWYAGLDAVICDLRAKASGTSIFDRTADYYFKATAYYSYAYHDFYNVAQNETKKLLSNSCDAGESFEWATIEKSLEHNWTERGCSITYQKCIITYRFTHR